MLSVCSTRLSSKLMINIINKMHVATSSIASIASSAVNNYVCMHPNL